MTFKNTKQTESKDCADEHDEQQKIAEYREKDQTSDIGVFRCHRHITRVENWNESPYSAPPRAISGDNPK